MEEWVGFKWHQYVTRQALAQYPAAAVRLEDEARGLGILFRALGGDPGLSLVAAEARPLKIRRRWLQRMAGTHRRFELAWRDQQSVRLPETIAAFPKASLNRDLYLWLAAMAACGPLPAGDWLVANQQAVTRVLASWPGLAKCYARLARACVATRPTPESMAGPERSLETAIQAALLSPGSVPRQPDCTVDPWPVPLWLYPAQGLPAANGHSSGDNDDPGNHSGGQRRRHKRKQAERVEAFDRDNGLMIFRLESLFSWTEFVPVDRAGDDTEEEDAAEVANDLDVISVSRDRSQVSASIKFDLDLPAEEQDDLTLGPGILLPEWDWRAQQYRERHCCLKPVLSKAPEADADGILPAHLRPTARRLQRQFRALKPQRQWLRRQADGEELDLDACLEQRIEQRRGAVATDPGLYRQCRPNQRDLACLVLADLSLSTDSHINDRQRVIDIIQDGLLLLGEALHASQDPFALCGFSSRRRSEVRFHHIKGFGERFDTRCRARIQALAPGYYTRMGAAIRQATRVLMARPEHQRLLLLLSDGKPNDLDVYEGRYGAEDTRKAVQEARQAGVVPFCVTIDAEANEYLPYLFGSNGYVVIRDPAQLPARLPLLYMSLVS